MSNPAPTSRRLADYPDALTVEEVAALLAISEPSARAAIAAGEIPHFRIGRLIRVPKAKLAVLLGLQPEPPAEKRAPRPQFTPRTFLRSA